MPDWQVAVLPTPLPYSVAGPHCRGHRLLPLWILNPMGVSLALAPSLLLSAMVAGLGPWSVALSVAVAAGARVAIGAALEPSEPSPRPLGLWPHLWNQLP